MEVSANKAPGADLAKYRTFAWAPQPNRPEPKASLLDQNVKADVQQQLATKGLLPAGDTPPDLLISYTAKSQTEYEYGGGPGYWNYGYMYPVKEGQLSLQFIDPKTKKVVWQGTASDVVDDNGGNPAQVAEAVKAMIMKYPVA
jgi:hypothetical protein